MNNPPPDQEKQEEYTSILVVHDAFLSGRMMLYELDTKPIRRMRYIGGPEVTTICALPEGYGWDLATPYMIGYAGIKQLELRGFKHLQTISHHFLFQSRLTSIDLSPLSNVTKIGQYFMAYCNQLESIDLTPFSKVTEIGSTFLITCDALTTIDLSPLVSLREVGTCFLFSCKSITTINVTLGSLQTVGAYFINSCLSLASVDLTSLINIKEVGNDFMVMCPSLSTVAVGPLLAAFPAVADAPLKGLTVLCTTDDVSTR